MEGTEEKREINHASSRQRDLLQSFIPKNNFPGKIEKKIPLEENEGGGEIELSLGLSLNGRFGVDPERAKKIYRASSISDFMFGSVEKGSKSLSLGDEYDPSLMRTSSLPTEAGEEWRKRKELQSLRRMEAKRKRMEKLKNGRVVRGKIELERNSEENGSGEIVSHVNGGEGVELKDENKLAHFHSQGSIGSQGSGGSSGVCDESPPIRGTNKNTEEGRPKSVKSPIEEKTNKPAVAVVENPPPKVASIDKKVKETMKNMMSEMPCVSTGGNGLNGKRVEGFLYRYRNGEEVKIVCVCHGSFLSPSEFVKHAGGGDVEHPLRHIVINPSPLL